LAAALYAKNIELVVVLLAPVVIVAAIYAQLMLHCGVGAGSDSPTLKVMSYNVWRSKGTSVTI
jgi:hypothetical protein